MAGDVIDLVSSSPEPQLRPAVTTNPARQSHQGVSGAAQSHKTNSLPKALPATIDFDLDDIADEFDTTGDIDAALHAPSQPRLQATTAQSVNGYPTTTQHVVLLSDDFDTTGGLSEPVLRESVGNKRRRLSPSPAAVATKVVTTGPAQRRSSPRRESLGLVDEFSDISDPFATSPLPATAEFVRTAHVTNVKSPSPRLAAHSSPSQVLPAVQRAPVSLPKDPLASSDPFASSPRSLHGTIDLSLDDPPPRPVAVSSRRQIWDPISSSAPEASMNGGTVRQYKPSSKAIEIDSDTDEAPPADDIDSDDLPDIDSLAKHVANRPPRSPLRRSRSEIVSSRGAARVTKASATAGGRTRERQTKASTKDAEKRHRQEEKARDKAIKDDERIRKRALAEANKHLADRKASTREMVVDLPSTLSQETKTHVEAMFEKLDVSYRLRQTPVDNVVLWRRKVCRRFNESLGHWEPVVERLVPEKYALVVVCAPEFVEMALKESLEEHVHKMDESFPDYQIIYLIEGMRKWFSSNRATLNRQFRANVRGEPSSSSARRRTAQEPVDESVVEDALLQLQVLHDKYIHHTEDAATTGDWIMTFTQHISAVPYKKAKEHALRDVGFCMESGQVRSGDGPKDTYLRMLQEIARVSAPMAHGIAAEFESVPALVNGMLRGGPERLSNVAKTVDGKGTLGTRMIGQAVSKRMYKIFTGRDETSTEV
ncbi:uncharacterized protein F5Z01DRAFT_726680 [Emericellopsis atlantica]|uniref:ERCC4 domain-containing protein n=1 Tax=Emericellopsis atlantica TaxID=2614577 RepID=A0A9P7ZIN0_9HYPO|nr:uncharacterized protein F5Z01DRAFT_726680 [Emericellopsis atlantica]KAG9252392.1 hypothetical protein F5Z01DRAFT_726680 [Emericellopsis atlantica]